MRGHVRKRGTKWCFVLDIGRDPETGKRQQKWFSGFKTKKEAEKEMISKMNEIEKGMFIASADITLKEYLDYWLQNYAKGAVKPNTLVGYTKHIQVYIIPFLGFLTLKQLQATHIQQFYNKLLANGRINGSDGLSAGTIRYIHSILRVALGHAVKWQLVSRNVVTLTEPPKIRKKEITTYDVDEVKKFLLYAKEHRYYIAFLLAVTTGLRRGEILGLRWKDVNLEAKTASIRKNLVWNKGEFLLQEPKTSRSVRLVTLPSMVINALIEYKQRQDQEKAKVGAVVYQDYDLIVTTSFGGPVNPDFLSKCFKDVIKKANLPNIRFHDLRHTHATLMLMQGEHPKVVSERLGHSNVSITMNTYSHVLPNMQYDAVERFEKMFINETDCK